MRYRRASGSKRGVPITRWWSSEALRGRGIHLGVELRWTSRGWMWWSDSMKSSRGCSRLAQRRSPFRRARTSCSRILIMWLRPLRASKVPFFLSLHRSRPTRRWYKISSPNCSSNRSRHGPSRKASGNARSGTRYWLRICSWSKARMQGQSMDNRVLRIRWMKRPRPRSTSWSCHRTSWQICVRQQYLEASREQLGRTSRVSPSRMVV